MKKNIWVLVMFALVAGNSFAAATITPRNQMIPRYYNAQYAQAQVQQTPEPVQSAEEQAVVQRKEFVDRLTELRDRESSLDKQAIQLIQDNSALASQLDQNNLERKRVKVDQKDVKRNIKELQKEKNIFDKKDKKRMKMDKLMYSN
ncbi:MAG: hypothetical protein IPP40_16370 [bacterium]|nr:hypothetical protein [bacterium]